MVQIGLKWMTKEVKGKSWLSRARRAAFACIMYVIWRARNKRVHEGVEMINDRLFVEIQTHVYQSLFVRYQYPKLEVMLIHARHSWPG